MDLREKLKQLDLVKGRPEGVTPVQRGLCIEMLLAGREVITSGGRCFCMNCVYPETYQTQDFKKKAE